MNKAFGYINHLPLAQKPIDEESSPYFNLIQNHLRQYKKLLPTFDGNEMSCQVNCCIKTQLSCEHRVGAGDASDPSLFQSLICLSEDQKHTYKPCLIWDQLVILRIAILPKQQLSSYDLDC